MVQHLHPGQPTNKNILEQNLNVNGYNIVSSGNGNVVIQSDGTGDIMLRNGTNATDTIIDGLDGFLKWNAPYVAAVNLPAYGTYTGMFAYLNDTKKAYFSSDTAWRELLDTTNSRLQDIGTVQDTTYADGEVPTGMQQTVSLGLELVAGAAVVIYLQHLMLTLEVQLLLEQLIL